MSLSVIGDVWRRRLPEGGPLQQVGGDQPPIYIQPRAPDDTPPPAQPPSGDATGGIQTLADLYASAFGGVNGGGGSGKQPQIIVTPATTTGAGGGINWTVVIVLAVAAGVFIWWRRRKGNG